jgi:hypothetical protein
MQNKAWIAVVTIATPLFGAAMNADAASVTLAWDRNSDPNIAGYRVYYGPTSGAYPSVIDAGNATQQVVNNLQNGITYYFAATAYNTAGVESEFSAEVSHTMPVPAISAVGDGSLRIHFRGVPGLTYRIQYSESLTASVWRSLGSRTADQAGMIQIIDRPATGAPTRFYRSVYP